MAADGARYRRFTHVDPFEDTESPGDFQRCAGGHARFTHVDPFEDTESGERVNVCFAVSVVSPTSIRSRILKGCTTPQ